MAYLIRNRNTNWQLLQEICQKRFLELLEYKIALKLSCVSEIKFAEMSSQIYLKREIQQLFHLFLFWNMVNRMQP